MQCINEYKMHLFIFFVCFLLLDAQIQRNKLNPKVRGYSNIGKKGSKKLLTQKVRTSNPKVKKLEVIDKQWNSYKKKIGRNFQRIDEDEARKDIFAENKRFIEEHNRLAEKGLKSYKLELNSFAHMTHEEFFWKYSARIPNRPKDLRRRALYVSSNTSTGRTLLPDSVDLREKGMVTPVKNQEKFNSSCGSCWAFAAVGALEGHLVPKFGKLVELSTQFFLDCDDTNMGCEGGDTYKAFEWAKDIEHIVTEDKYPYTGKKSECPFPLTKKENKKTKAYVQIPPGDEETMMEVIATKGPLSVIFDARDQDFQFVTNGKGDIYSSDRCSKNKKHASHGATIIGYGTNEANVKYWLVKNSYGKDWGDHGYFRISRNNNTCGIANEVTYPIV